MSPNPGLDSAEGSLMSDTPERRATMYILVHPNDCDPPHGLDLSTERDAGKVERLRQAFVTHGFDPKMPALVGYPLKGRIQLLSGTHRHLAAQLAGIDLPVRMVLRSVVETTWGTELWVDTIRDIPVEELENAVVPENRKDSPYDPVDLEAMFG